MSLKEIGWIEKHFAGMVEDCLEFNNYALRKGAVNNQIQVVNLLTDVYNSHYASRCLINTVKGISKVQKLSTADMDQYRAEYLAYQGSDEYKAW